MRAELDKFPADCRDDVVILFSAHSLPMKVKEERETETETDRQTDRQRGMEGGREEEREGERERER